MLHSIQNVLDCCCLYQIMTVRCHSPRRPMLGFLFLRSCLSTYLLSWNTVQIGPSQNLASLWIPRGGMSRFRLDLLAWVSVFQLPPQGGAVQVYTWKVTSTLCARSTKCRLGPIRFCHSPVEEGFLLLDLAILPISHCTARITWNNACKAPRRLPSS